MAVTPRSATDPAGLAPTATCAHCGTLLESAQERFCCAGCQAADAIIRGAGLERYYEEREVCPARPAPLEPGWGTVPVEARPDGSAEVRLQVDGLRCASCVWLLEHVLERTPGVEQAMVSYASGRATVRWQPGRVDLPAIARRIAALGYTPRPLGAERAPDRALLVRFGTSVFLAAGLMFIYEGLYAGWFFAMSPAATALFRWVALALATPLTLWCASPFFAGAWQGLRSRVLAMDLPLALGIGVLYVHGLYATLARVDAYLDSLGMLVALLLLGRMIEGRGRRRAVEAAMALAASAPRSARRQVGESLETVPAASLVPGDRIDVGAGEELPADGIVAEGAGQVRMALMTGEAAPVSVGPGDRVVAGTVLLDGALTVTVEAAGSATTLSRMTAQLEQAADRPALPTLADRLAPWFTGATLAIAALTFLGWSLARDTGTALAHTIAVLVVACPCTLALAQPLAGAAALGATARRGLLFRSTDALLALEHADVVALDKTGTVTAGAVTVLAADDGALRVAAALERYSAHPIARAITEAAVARGIALPRATQVQEAAGHGITGCVDGRRWTIESGGPGLVELVDEQGRRAPILLGDRLRDDAADAVTALRADGMTTVLVTGDHADVAHQMADAAGIPRVVARTTPDEKAAWIARQQAQGRRVVFVGDGLNDGPALAQADIGIAMGTGAASSVLVADAVIVTPSLQPLVAARRAARACARAVKLNAIVSVGYNVLAVGAAVAGLVNPLVAAVLMPLSSVTVIWIASRVEPALRRAER